MRSLRVLVVLLLLATACGGGEDMTNGAPVRTVDVAMEDVAFQPASVSVAEGETVLFRFTNNGQLPHDAFIGDTAAQDEHEEGMAGGHGGHGGRATDALSLAPGGSGEIVHTFQAGDVMLIGCHQPGHYDSGMVLSISVTPT